MIIYKSIRAFTKKEFMECLRLQKFTIILSIFLIFGMTNPIVAKIMPDLFKNMEGVTIEFPVPTILDAWVQFYQNIMIQILMFVILFSNTISNEVLKGTLINFISKGVSRTSIILSKFCFVAFMWTICLLTSVFSTYYISMSILGGEVNNLLFALFTTWVFGILLVGVMIFGSVSFQNLYGAMLTVFLFYILGNLLNIIPIIKNVNPYRMISDSYGILNGTLNPSDLMNSLMVSVILLVAFVSMSIIKFKNINL